MVLPPAWPIMPLVFSFVRGCVSFAALGGAGVARRSIGRTARARRQRQHRAVDVRPHGV